MSASRFSRVLRILELAIKRQQPIKQVLEEEQENPRLVSDFMYDLGKERTNLPKHLEGRVKILYAQAVSQVHTDLPQVEKAKAVLKKQKSISVEEFADLMDLSPSKAKSLLTSLSNEGYSLVEENNRITVSAPRISSHTLESVERFGAIGDTHLGSKYERLDLLHRTYDRFEALGVTKVFHTGNWIDGEARFNFSDIHVHGLDNQINYFLEHYPKRKGITTYYIGGDK